MMMMMMMIINNDSDENFDWVDWIDNLKCQSEHIM